MRGKSSKEYHYELLANLVFHVIKCMSTKLSRLILLFHTLYVGCSFVSVLSLNFHQPIFIVCHCPCMNGRHNKQPK